MIGPDLLIGLSFLPALVMAVLIMLTGIKSKRPVAIIFFIVTMIVAWIAPVTVYLAAFFGVILIGYRAFYLWLFGSNERQNARMLLCCTGLAWSIVILILGVIGIYRTAIYIVYGDNISYERVTIDRIEWPATLPALTIESINSHLGRTRLVVVAEGEFNSQQLRWSLLWLCRQVNDLDKLHSITIQHFSVGNQDNTYLAQVENNMLVYPGHRINLGKNWCGPRRYKIN